MNSTAPTPFVMQQVQAFSTDAYQSRCGGIGNMGMGAAFPGPTMAAGGKHFKVHTNNAGFNNFNYVHGDPEGRAMTRIVYNGNGNRNDFHCAGGADAFQNCVTGEVIDNTGNYQLNFLSGNPNMNNNMNVNNMRYMRQPMNPNFHGDNQMQRCYIQRPQGQQARFVRVQGSKMRPNGMYRNFNNNQQRQKQNRRFTTKVFNNNNYKSQRSNCEDQPDEFFDEESSDNSPNRNMQMQHECQGGSPSPGKDNNLRKSSANHHSKQEGQQNKSKSQHRSNTSGNDSHNHSHGKGNSSTGSGLLEPKMEFFGDSLHDLSYDDITENSDDNEDSDLRERLMRKKHDQIVKREPGELDSDDEDVDPPPQQEKEVKRKAGRKSLVEESSKKLKSSEAPEKQLGRSKEVKKFQKSGKNGSFTSHNSAYYHDDRSGSSKEEKGHKSKCPGSNFHPEFPTSNYCCAEAEVADLKEKMNNMKESLRDAQDKLLEANVVGSKKALRLQEEITHLKKKLEEAAKSETDLKASLKNVENELSIKNAELNKISLLNEVDKQEKAKFSAEMTRTYRERLTIEVEKLRALFDVEVAKMQAFYMSSNIYEEDTGMPFVSEAPTDADLQNQNNLAARNEGNAGNVGDMETMNINHCTRDVNSNREVPFVQAYFNTSPQITPSMSGATPFSLFENVMAYNSLIHHQHIYAQTTASAAAAATGTNCSDSSGNASSVAHSGM